MKNKIITILGLMLTMAITINTSELFALDLQKGDNYDEILLSKAESEKFEKPEAGDNIIMIGAEFVHNSEKNEFTFFWILKPSTYSEFSQDQNALKTIISKSLEENINKENKYFYQVLIKNNTKLVFNLSSNNRYFEITFTVEELKKIFN